MAFAFPERFRVARARARMTLADVAQIMDVSPQMVKKYEDGKSMPGSRALLDFCRAVDCSVEWLMDPNHLDFQSTDTAPQGRHAKYWVREAIEELREIGFL